MTKNAKTTLSVGEAAEVCKVSPNTVRSWDRRFGFPPTQRTPGGHRRYNYSDIKVLASLLEEGLPISSVIKVLNSSIAEDVWLPRALETYDRQNADEVMERVVAVRPFEKAMAGTLLPSVMEVGENHGYQSAAWAFASGWALDWMKEAGNLLPEPHRGSILIGDANKGQLGHDALSTAALEIYTKRLGFEVVNLAVENSEGIDDVVNQINPNGVILAGSSSSSRSVTGWSNVLQDTEHPVSHLFHHPFQLTEAAVLPDDPYAASKVFE